jgi:hypothetical protein
VTNAQSSDRLIGRLGASLFMSCTTTITKLRREAMAYLLILTLVAILATGAVTLRERAFHILEPLNHLLDRLGHDVQALARATECPPL